MLVRITNQCVMGCSHCMVNACPEGAHMSIDTFRMAIDFIRDTQEGIVMISGGEPIEPPEFFEIAEIAKKSGLMPLILSNGMFVENESLRERVLELGINIQITNDERFYPKRIFEYKHRLIAWESAIRVVSPFGRALKNGLAITRQSPLCFNLRSVVRSMRSFVDGIRYLRMSGKFCTPSINVDGSIVAGEAPECCKIGHVGDSMGKVASGILDMQCNRCGLEDNLGEKYKQAIGLVV